MNGCSSVAKVDYLVSTFSKTLHNQALTPRLAGIVADGEPAAIRNYYGKQKGKVFFGDNYHRYMLVATSYAAHEFLTMHDLREFEELSIARLDIQVTLRCHHVDQTISLVRPAKMYNCTLITSLYGEGTTLYVGAPSSRVRCRIYNKTAEAGVRSADGYELMRVEFQLRDRYADFALVNFYAGQLDRLFLSHTRKMTDEYIASLVERELREGEAMNRIPNRDDETPSAIARRIGWLQHSVRPALIKLSMMDREAALDFLEQVIYDIRNTNPDVE